MTQGNIHRMRERHEKEIADLQAQCSHSNSHRSRFMWAIGHFGNDVEVCDDCGKLLKSYDERTPIGEPL